MPPFPPLAELQRLLHRLIRAPEGVEAGLQEMRARGEIAEPDLSFAIEPSASMSAETRLDVYADMYFYRLLETLLEDYPKTRSRIGSAHFHNLATDYLLAHPPTHASLRQAGAALPGFVASHPLAEEFPALADVARLERTRVELFDAEDSPVLAREDFLEASARNPEHFELVLITACRVLDLEAGALDFWQDPDRDQIETSPSRIATFVYRKGFDVFHRPCIEDEAICLEELFHTSITLPQFGERLLRHDASAEDTAERFARLLERWLDDEVLAKTRHRAAA